MNPIADLLTRAKARTLAHPRLRPAAAVEHEYIEKSDVFRVMHSASRSLGCDSVGHLTDTRPDLIPQMFDLAIEEASK